MVPKIAYWTTTIIAAAMLLMALTYLTGSAQIVAAINHLGVLSARAPGPAGRFVFDKADEPPSGRRHDLTRFHP